MNEPRTSYTEWSKSEREKQISYINAYIWNVERWYWWTYLQSSNGDTDIENRFGDTVGEGDGGTNGESSMKTYTFTICKTDSQWEFAIWHTELELGLCDNLEGWDRGSKGKGRMYAYGWFTLMHGRNQCNTVKQLSSN